MRPIVRGDREGAESGTGRRRPTGPFMQQTAKGRWLVTLVAGRTDRRYAEGRSLTAARRRFLSTGAGWGPGLGEPEDEPEAAFP